MLVVVGMALLTIGVVLIPAAYACFRLPGISPRVRKWIGGETASVMLATLPATGLIALFYFLVETRSRDIDLVHFAAAAAIAVAGGIIARWFKRFGARLEQARIEAGGGDDAGVGPEAAALASNSIPEKRAA